MKIPFVDLKAQYLSIEDEIHSAIKEVLDNAAFIKGESVEAFERNFASLVGAKHCIGVGNGTDALIISLKSIGVGLGDEVIVPANSFIATAEAVTAIGARVVFVDNNPITYNINIDEIEKKITSKTKAIIPVHLYGQMSDMDPICNIANKYNLKVIEDAAQSVLSEYQLKNKKWVKAGTLGSMATFSFFPGKNLGAYGDAGAIITNDDELATLARKYANHGRIAKYNHELEGYNSRLDELQAAILDVKLKYLQEWTEKRKEIASKYSTILSDNPGITLPFVGHRYHPVWHLYVIRAKNRNALQSYLKAQGISTGIHYPLALPNLQAYKYLGYTKKAFPVASQYQEELLSLPVYPEISTKEVEYVAYHIKSFYNKSTIS